MLADDTVKLPVNDKDVAEFVIYPAPFVNWLLFVIVFVTVTAPVPWLTLIPVPATTDVTPVFAMVTAPLPLYDVPLNPVPIVKVAKLEPKAIPEIVEFVNLALEIEPASIASVTPPVAIDNVLVAAIVPPPLKPLPAEIETVV